MSVNYPLPAEFYRRRWRAARDAEAMGVTTPGLVAMGDASFGRYVARTGGVITPSAPGYRAWARLAYRPGFCNRAHRRALLAQEDWTCSTATPDVDGVPATGGAG